jgi:hypothetical protein
MAVGGVGYELVSVVGLTLFDASFVTKSPGLFVTRNRGVAEGIDLVARYFWNALPGATGAHRCQE